MKASLPQRPSLHDNLIDPPEVCQATKLSRRTIERLCAQGLMPRPIKLGAQNRWSRHAIEEWMSAGCPAVKAS